MNVVIVAEADKGRFKVMHNYIQVGVDYSNKAQAEKEAETLKIKIFGKAKKD